MNCIESVSSKYRFYQYTISGNMPYTLVKPCIQLVFLFTRDNVYISTFNAITMNYFLFLIFMLSELRLTFGIDIIIQLELFIYLFFFTSIASPTLKSLDHFPSILCV